MANTSTKRAARLAQKGSGQSVRFQGGTVFPIAVALTLILGLALIVYARQSLPAADESPPSINDHWHIGYGFYLCDGWVQLDGDLEEVTASGALANTNFLRTGIHSHDDGVMHWHPYTSRAVGRNAVLDVFLETYEVELTDDSLTFPGPGAVTVNDSFAGQGPSEILEEYIEGETQCNGEDAELSVRVWENFTDTDSGNRFVANMGNIRVDNDAMVMAIYFTDDDADQVMPPWAQNLPALGAVDTGVEIPSDVTDISVPRLQVDDDTAETTGEDVSEDTSDDSEDSSDE